MTLLAGKNKFSKKAFSMVEMMVATIIVGVCITLVLRGFSGSAAAISKAHYKMLAVDVLQDRLARLKEKAVMENGIKPGSSRDNIRIGNRSLIYTEAINEWQQPLEITETGEPKGEAAQKTSLCEVTLRVSWKTMRKGGQLVARTIIPKKGFRDKF